MAGKKVIHLFSVPNPAARFGAYGPPCFPQRMVWERDHETKQWRRVTHFRSWQTLARMVRPAHCGDHPWCADCTPEYQQEMIAANRCLHQETQFGLDEDGFISGFEPKPDEPSDRAKGPRGGRTVNRRGKG